MYILFPHIFNKNGLQTTKVEKKKTKRKLQLKVDEGS